MYLCIYVLTYFNLFPLGVDHVVRAVSVETGDVTVPVVCGVLFRTRQIHILQRKKEMILLLLLLLLLL